MEKKEQRSNKWAFLIYRDSAPNDYLQILNELHIPYILSPWHDRDVNSSTGEVKKAHKHGAFYFQSLKSYSQVSTLLSEKLNAPKHIEIVYSPKGMYDYFTHAENPEKTPYQIDDIEWGCGFELEKFLIEYNTSEFLNNVLDVIEENDFVEFEELVMYARNNDYMLLQLIVDKTFFFTKLLDSRRYGARRKLQVTAVMNDNNDTDKEENNVVEILVGENDEEY